MIDLGTFSIYVPADHPLSGRFTFFRNDAGEDWYDLVSPVQSEPLREGQVCLLLYATGVVYAATTKPWTYFPVLYETRTKVTDCLRAIIIDGFTDEVIDDEGHFPGLRGRIFDIATGTFTTPPPPPILAVSAAQAKLALFNAGLLDTVKATVLAHPYAPVSIWYDDASVWDRWNPYVLAIAEELGLTEDQVDALFADAAKLG